MRGTERERKMEKEEVETVAGRREKERFSLGKNEFLAGIVVPARDGPGQNGPPPSGEKVREEEGGRDLGGDFSEKERNDPGWGEGGTLRPNLPALPRLRPFVLPYVRAVTRETRTSMQNGSTSAPLLIVSDADTRIVHLMARARNASRAGDADFNYYREEERTRAEGWTTNPGDVGEIGGSFGCNHFRITASDRDGHEVILLWRFDARGTTVIRYKISDKY